MSNRSDGFSYSQVGDEVVITHHGHPATTLRGRAAERFLADVEQDPQQLMALATGNYKHGNERAGRDHLRNQRR